MTFLSSLLSFASLLAHPDHGTTDPSSWLHYLTQPMHLVVLGGAAVLAVMIGGSRRGMRTRRLT